MMTQLDIPVGKRTRQYRFFETLPALLSYGAIFILILLSLIDPLWASAYLLLIIVTVLVKAVGIAFHTIKGRSYLDRAQLVHWRNRLDDLERPEESLKRVPRETSAFGSLQHHENLRFVAAASDSYPKPSEIYNAVIIAAYNESYEVLDPTLQSVIDTTYDNDRLIIVIAYEERGGAAIEATARKLEEKYADKVYAFHLVEHPRDLENEVVGKGGNITYAGHYLKYWLDAQAIAHDRVIVTTLDSDNRPHRSYFDYVTYEYIVRDNRKHLSYQPVSLFLNNIWDVPAPMRVLATGNSFWNIISSVRPHMLRNFASHSQPMDALVEMDFWSTRTVVEDGHQYWRSYFYFNGNYSVVPIYVPIYQDAVLSDTYKKTLKAQFIQLRRWAYGASDVPYVASHIFTKKRTAPLGPALARLIRLIDGHVTLASVAVLVTIGGWIPLLINSEAARSMAAHQLPEVISVFQRFAMVGLFITIFLALKMLPPRPARYRKHRSFLMLIQWVLMPVTSVLYGSLSALDAQTRLAFGKYLDKFDVTEKATHESVARAKQQRGKKRL